MKIALVNLAKVFGQLLATHYELKFDHATSRLITALADWVEANEEPRS